MPDIAVARPKTHSFNPIKTGQGTSSAGTQGKKLASKLSQIAKEWEARQKNPEYTTGKAPTTAGISKAAMLQHARRMSQAGFQKLRAGDYNDQNDPDYYNNPMGGMGMNGMSPPIQDMQIKPLSPAEDKRQNEFNTAKISGNLHDIFSGDEPPHHPSKLGKIYELLPLVDLDAQKMLTNIAANEPIFGHGNKRWSDLTPHEQQGVINHIKSKQLSHSDILLNQQTGATVHDQVTTMLTNRVMAHNNMIATFMPEILQLAKKWTEMMRSSV
jgi:hypothetical protein